MRLHVFCICLLILVVACGRKHSSPDNTAAEIAADDITAGDIADNKTVHEAAMTIHDLWAADSIAWMTWGNPASPRRDETQYIKFLESLLAIDSLPDALHERATHRLHVAMLNRPGSIAADFRYLERNGEKSRLHSIKSPFTLLIFYDPECPHCADILTTIASSETINRAIADKSLTLLAVYAEGKRDVWRKTRNDMPHNWLVGYDLTGILDEGLYDLPAMPIPYLLDSDKRVILKDPQIRTLIGIISQM